MDNNSKQDYLIDISDEILAAFLDGNVSEEEANRIIDSIGYDPEVSEILSLSSLVDMRMRNATDSILPIWRLAAADQQNLCSFECELSVLRRFDYNIDRWSLLETAKINNWVRETGTPLHHVGRLLELKGLYVERRYDTKTEDLRAALTDNKAVIVVVDKNILHDNGDALKSTSPSYHALYVTDMTDNGVMVCNAPDSETDILVDNNMFIESWKSTGNYMVTASKSTCGYSPQPINVEGIELDDTLVDLTEAIAENVHDIWARARIDEGWVYGPTRDDGKKHHPDLVPYSILPESEKEYDRILAMNTLRLVRRLGFDIVKSHDND